MSDPRKDEFHIQPRYFIVISEITLKHVFSYKNNLLSKKVKPGFYFENHLQKFIEETTTLDSITNENFIGLLLATKKPIIFASDDLKCDGSDWNSLELQILGDINIAMPVQVFDNGVWFVNDSEFKKHEPPLLGQLLFTPGPLFSKSELFIGETPEYLEVVRDNKIDQNKYNKLIERRLSPLFTYANETAKKENHSAFITIPGLGCGEFAGEFRGTLGERLNQALKYVIEKNAKNYTHIECVFYDPFEECKVESKDFNSVKYRVRPYSSSGKPQLSAPQDYQEGGDDFTNCKLYKIVAWDHLSYPGNDFFVGSRFTDDGMAGAATNSMEVITGFKGNYHNGKYLPPKGLKNWEDVVLKNSVKLVANGNVLVVTESGSYLTLNEYEQTNLNQISD